MILKGKKSVSSEMFLSRIKNYQFFFYFCKSLRALISGCYQVDYEKYNFLFFFFQCLSIFKTCFILFLVLQRKEQERLYQQKQKKVTSSPSLEEWLEKRAKHPVKKVSTKVVFPQWSLPPNLRHVPNLPPSLLAPSMQDFNLDRIDWG